MTRIDASPHPSHPQRMPSRISRTRRRPLRVKVQAIPTGILRSRDNRFLPQARLLSSSHQLIARLYLKRRGPWFFRHGLHRRTSAVTSVVRAEPQPPVRSPGRQATLCDWHETLELERPDTAFGRSSTDIAPNIEDELRTFKDDRPNSLDGIVVGFNELVPAPTLAGPVHQSVGVSDVRPSRPPSISTYVYYPRPYTPS